MRRAAELLEGEARLGGEPRVLSLSLHGAQLLHEREHRAAASVSGHVGALEATPGVHPLLHSHPHPAHLHPLPLLPRVYPPWQAEPLSPGAMDPRVVIEADATEAETRGSFTLKLWDADGTRSVIVTGATFP